MKTAIILSALIVCGYANAAVDPLQKELSRIAKSNLSCRSHSDCIQVAVGAKGCGGPAGYVLTSRNNMELEALIELANRITADDAARFSNSNLVSTCEFVEPKLAGCSVKTNQCEIVK